MILTGLSSLGGPGVPWHTQIGADQLALFQPGGTDYAHLITIGTPRFSDFPTALQSVIWDTNNFVMCMQDSGNYGAVMMTLPSDYHC